MFDILLWNKEDKESILPQMFDVLYKNMSQIDPTGNTQEEDYQVWKHFIIPALEKKEREILLIKHNNSMAGYFQYTLDNSVLYMEEVQIHHEFWGSGAFTELYRYLVSIIPETNLIVKANASKTNLRSQAILEHLGLKRIRENQNGRSYHYIGKWDDIVKKYSIKK